MGLDGVPHKIRTRTGGQSCGAHGTRVHAKPTRKFGIDHEVYTEHSLEENGAQEQSTP